MTDLVWALDVNHSYQPNLAGLIEAHKPGHVITKLFLPEESAPQQGAIEHVQTCREMQVPPGGYYWGYRSLSPERSLEAVLELCARIGLVLPILWLDCETYGTTDPGPDAAWLRATFALADALQTPVGIYTGCWWVDGVFPGRFEAYEEFLDRPHWITGYGAPESGLSGAVWWGPKLPNIVARQWSGGKDPTWDNLDHDLILPQYVTAELETIPEPPPVDDLAALRADVERLKGMHRRFLEAA